MADRQITEQQMRMQFAQNLQYLRKSKKHYISQDSFARLMNLPLKTIRNYEAGRSSPMAYDVYRLCNYYGYTMEELLTKKLYSSEHPVKHAPSERALRDKVYEERKNTP